MIGTTAGNFKIIEEIGEGGMGKVYKGVDTMLEREVAIKVLRPELTSQLHLVERFRSEAMTLAKLNHPHIGMLYAFFRQNEHFFMVLEFLRGETLDKRIRRTGLLAFDQAIRIFVQTLEAIGYAHSMGVIHRDIKPNNIMITEGEVVKVMDFGIARVLGSERMTLEGSMIGTPEYMAPEQIRGHEMDTRTDIYALGILLYEMLTGRLPFMNQNQFELMRSHIETPPPPPRSFAPHLPESVERVMLCALAKNKDDRFPTAFDFRDALLNVPDVPPLSQLLRPMAGAGTTTSPDSRRFSQPDYHRTTDPTAQRGSVEQQNRQTMDARQPTAQEAIRRSVGPTGQPQQYPTQPRPGQAPAPPRPVQQPRPSEPIATQVIPQPAGAPTGYRTEAAAPAPPSGGMSKALLLGGGVLVALLVGVIAWFALSPTPEKDPGTPTKKTSPPVAVNMAEITGGSFRLGRVDDQPKGDEDPEWIYKQTPAHVVVVQPFAIDKTEVTNAEYAQFVKDTNHEAPKDWNGAQPPAGQENYPVRNVSYQDAVQFAEWRSQRDDKTYRLPTEEEWELAAKGSVYNNRFPWGDSWIAGNANVASQGPQTVGSSPQGATAAGVQDLIGNVAEWTSSEASIYPGNTKVAALPDSEKGKMVVRGGSYISQPVGLNPISVTARGWLPVTDKQPYIGFRLVRPSQ